MAANITCELDRRLPRPLSGEVALQLTDGRVQLRAITDRHGTQQGPISPDEVLAKFMSTASRAVPEDQACRIAALAADLDDIACFIPACTGAATTG